MMSSPLLSNVCGPFCVSGRLILLNLPRHTCMRLFLVAFMDEWGRPLRNGISAQFVRRIIWIGNP